MQWTTHTQHILKVYNLTEAYTIAIITTIRENTSITSRSFLTPLVILPSYFTLPHNSNKSLIHFLSLYISIYFLDIYIKLINIVYTLFIWLISHRIIILRFIHLTACVNSSFLLLISGIHFIDIPHLFIHW